MSKRSNLDDNKTNPAAKIQKYEPTSEIAFDQNPSPDIFRLHAIVCFELFDYLSLKDLHSMGQTCKRFNRIAGDYFKNNYSAAEIEFCDQNICYGTTHINRFSEYIQNIKTDVTAHAWGYIAKNHKSLKQIIFADVESRFEANKIGDISEVLGKIEKITLPHISGQIS